MDTPLQLWVSETYAESVRLGLKAGRLLYHAVSPFQTIDIIETAYFGRMLLLDGLVMTSERDEFVYHEMIAHPAMLCCPVPRRVLIIGGGDGGSAREVLRHPGVEEVVLCEIDGAVVDACREFLPSIAGQLGDPRVRIEIRDGIAYMADCAQAGGNRFDVILIDSTDPMGPGEGLFTESFYRNARQCLTPGGVMANQTESPVAHAREQGLIYDLLRRTFAQVSPYWAVIPTYPGAMWTWAICSGDENAPTPRERLTAAISSDPAIAARLTSLEPALRYLNGELLPAAFALPTFARQRMAGEPTPWAPGLT
ncbi:MAG: polyamine aminopropyltransferase [Vampirovibrionales bacterium]|nr:polyamine aminopropyltransferase [Vampirovibrionales bacterium]